MAASSTLAFSRSLIVATAGHVDHGKTSLVRALTGVDTDTLADEKDRGLTINLGYAYAHREVAGEPLILGFVDVPGHRDFINNALAGLASVDCAMLVVAADDGIMPQTLEHLQVLDLLGIRRGLVALTKIDRCEAQQVQARQQEIDMLLAGTALDGVPVVPVSSITGAGLEALERGLLSFLEAGGPVLPSEETASSNSNWGHHQPGAAQGGTDRTTHGAQTNSDPLDSSEHPGTLAGEKNASARPEAAGGTTGAADLVAQPARFLIDRSFTVKGIGTVVTGTLLAGRLGPGETLLHTGTGQSVRIKTLRLHDRELQGLIPGQRAALNLNLSYQEVERGDWLLGQAGLHPVSRFDARLTGSDAALNPQPSTQYHLHCGASHRIANLRQLSEAHPEFVQVTCQPPLFVRHGDRFIVRDPAGQQTLGGGSVIDTYVPRRHRSSPSRLAELHAQAHPPEQALERLLDCTPTSIDLNRFATNRNLSKQQVSHIIERLVSRGIQAETLDLGDPLPRLLATSLYRHWRDAIVDWLRHFHDEYPNQPGASATTISSTLVFADSHAVLQVVLDRLVKEGSLARIGTTFHLPEHQASLNQTEQEFLDRIRPLLLKAGNVAPRTREIAEATDMPLRLLEQLLKEVTRAGHLVKVADNRYYLPETLSELAEFTEKLARENGSDDGFSVIQFRDASGMGRNLCIEILEYFDRAGFTSRQGNVRYLRTSKDNLFGA